MTRYLVTEKFIANENFEIEKTAPKLSAKTQKIFLGNHFWTCLYQSGILSESITSDRDVEVLSNGVGLVNVVSRTTASSQDLSSAEIREGCRRLVDKLQLLQVFL